MKNFYLRIGFKNIIFSKKDSMTFNVWKIDESKESKV